MAAERDTGPGEPEAPAPAVCKRPGCGNPVQQKPGRGRPKMFCSTACAGAFHNSARIPASAETGLGQDPLTALEPLLREAVVMAKAAREQAEGLDPAKVRVEIADAEAARRRAEASVVTAQARQAEAESEAEALAEALDAAREDKEVAEEKATTLAAELEAARGEAEQRGTAVRAGMETEITAAREHAAHAQEELDRALNRARDVQAAADAETARARQAEADARAEIERVRADAERERRALAAACDAQLAGKDALIEAQRDRAERAEEQLAAERSERRQLSARIAPAKNGRVASMASAPKKTASRTPVSAEAGAE